MVRKSALVVVLAFVVAMGLISVEASPASADVIDWAARGLPEWSFDAAEDIYNGCEGFLDMPAEFMEKSDSDAQLGYVAPIGAAPLLLSGGATAALAAPVTLTTGTVGVVVGTFVGVGCSTIGLHSLVFGNPFRTEPPPSSVGLLPVTQEAGPCMDFTSPPTGTQTGDWCMTATFPSGASIWQLQRATSDGTDFTWWPQSLTRQSNGSLGVNRTITGGASNTIAFPCATPSNACGLGPLLLEEDAGPYPDAGVEHYTNGSAASWGPSATTHRTHIHPLQFRGYQRRMHTRINCNGPGGGVQNVYSDPFWDDEPAEDPPAATCVPGDYPVEVTIERQTMIGGSTSAASWTTLHPSTDTVLDWEMHPDVRSNPSARQCWVVGVTNCPIYDPDPEDPDADLELGGSGGLAFPKTAPRVGTLTVPDIIEHAPWPETDPTPTTAPSTTAAPTTLPTPTTVPEDSDAPPPGAPGGPQAPGTEGGDCFPGGWGWLNPVEWVLKPVKCALVWAFWDQDAADEIAELTVDTGWPDLVADSSFDTSTASGPCIPIDDAEICTQPILEMEAPEYVQVLIAALVSFFVLFEVVGLFARITQT